MPNAANKLSDADIDALTKRTQDGGTEVVQAKAGKVNVCRTCTSWLLFVCKAVCCKVVCCVRCHRAVDWICACLAGPAGSLSACAQATSQPAGRVHRPRPAGCDVKPFGQLRYPYYLRSTRIHKLTQPMCTTRSCAGLCHPVHGVRWRAVCRCLPARPQRRPRCGGEPLL